MSATAQRKGVDALVQKARSRQLAPPAQERREFLAGTNFLSSDAAADDESRDEGVPSAVWIPLDLIDENTWQPRAEASPSLAAESILNLAKSIDDPEIGQTNSVQVRKKDNGRYELISGSRRYRAHKLLGRENISAVIKHVTNRRAAVLSYTENDQREEMSDYERAMFFHRFSSEFGEASVKDLGDAFHTNPKEIYRLRSFWTLPDEVHSILRRKPNLIGKAYAEKFEELCRRSEEATSLVIDYLQKGADLEEGKFKPKHALDAIEKRLSREPGAPQKKTPRKSTEVFCEGLSRPSATLARKDRRITLELDAEIDPVRFEAWFKETMAGALAELRATDMQP